MSMQGLTRSNPVSLWWLLLTLASCGNIALWCLLYSHFHPRSASGLVSASGFEAMLLLCAAYVFGCAFRSVLPRADTQRICLFDTWLSSVVVGRSVATVAEVCFAAQWAIVLQHLGTTTNAGLLSNIAMAIVPLIVAAQVCCWYGVLTTSSLAHAIENSIWAFTFLLVGIGLGRLLPEFDGGVRVALVLAIVGIGCFLTFLLLVDVPMYLSRWHIGRANGSRLLRPLEGLRDASTRWVVTRDIAHWKDEMAWMSLYFTAAVWASLGLSLFYFLVGSPGMLSP